MTAFAFHLWSCTFIILLSIAKNKNTGVLLVYIYMYVSVLWTFVMPHTTYQQRSYFRIPRVTITTESVLLVCWRSLFQFSAHVLWVSLNFLKHWILSEYIVWLSDLLHKFRKPFSIWRAYRVTGATWRYGGTQLSIQVKTRCMISCTVLNETK